MNVIFDEIKVMQKKHNVDGIIIDESIKTVDDFTHLVNIIYRDSVCMALLELASAILLSLDVLPGFKVIIDLDLRRN